MSVIEIGCCCAYCKTCRAFRDGSCRGCRLGYENGQRDINRAKCKMKVCCMREKQLQTCADCDEFSACELLQKWYKKAGGKYQRYRDSGEFIRRNGYDAFVKIADNWKDSRGKLG